MKIFLFALLFYPFLIINAQWVQTNGPYGGTINCIAADGAHIFAGTENGGIFLSNNNSGNWTAVNNGLPIGTNIYFSSIRSLLISGTKVFAGTNGIYLSTDYGNSWTLLSLSNNNINALVLSGAYMFAATPNGIYLSIDCCPTNTAINR